MARDLKRPSPSSALLFLITTILSLLGSSAAAPAAQASNPPSPASPSPTATPTNDPDDDFDPGYSSNVYLFHYLVLVLVFIIILALAYWVFVRRRRRLQAMAALQSRMAGGRQWPPYPGQAGGGGGIIPMHRRFRGNNNPNIRRHEEGLDERGEAPPPYVPEKQADAFGSGKPPPEYESLPDHLSMPPPTHHPDNNAGPSQPRPIFA